MKKLFLGAGMLLLLLGTSACERTNTKEETTAEDNTRVVKRDSVATEYEVTETVVEYDTTQRTKTVKAEPETENRDNDNEVIKVKKDRD